jgi:2-polyprenyl-6-methoxyphenol hydroxylase-like FAD-dependent oxidoreductase
MRVAVAGGGVSGMLAALMLARDGHQVTVVERDDTPLPPTPDEAFESWQRTGAPHARQSHALLARLRLIMGDRMPDVLTTMAEWGVTELTVDRLMPTTITDRTPLPGDDQIVLLACRRLTLEWALRRAVLAEPGVTWKGGVGASGLHAEGTDVRGLGLEDGSIVPADVVAVGGGRRSPIMQWIAGLGGATQPEEEIHECGIVYYSRFYKLADGCELPVLPPGSGSGDLGYLKFGGFYGDNRSFSVTLASHTDDAAMRKLSRNAHFEAALRSLPGLDAWTARGLATPITDVQTMARLRNRIRRFVADGVPVATGLAVIGDAAACTNPLLGKGCSTGGMSALALSRALAAHPTDRHAFALALHDSMTAEIEPHYRASRKQDEDTQAARDGSNPTAVAIRDFVLNGLMAATRFDPVVFRAFFRTLNMLDPPDALMANHDVLARAQAAYADKDNRPPLPKLGPDRDEMLEIFAAC